MRLLRKRLSMLVSLCLALSLFGSAFAEQRVQASGETLGLNSDPDLIANWSFNEFNPDGSMPNHALQHESAALSGGSADTVPPSAPANLTAGEVTDRSVELIWKESADNEAVAFYHIYVQGEAEPIRTIPAPPDAVLYDFDSGTQGFVPLAEGVAVTHDTSIKHAGEGSLKVSFDAFGSEQYFDVVADFPPIPHPGGVLSAYVYIPEGTPLKELGISSWGKDWQNHVANFKPAAALPKGQWFKFSVEYGGDVPSPRMRFRIGTLGEAGEIYFDTIAYSAGTVSALVDGLAPDTSYVFSVKAEDLGGNLSDASNSLAVTTLTEDTEPPTAPADVSASMITNTSATLNWSASTDNRKVTRYHIYIDGSDTPAATVPADENLASFSYTFKQLMPATTYIFTIKAEDSSGLLSEASAPIEVTTLEFLSNENASLGMNLASLTDYANFQLFKDIFKQARVWNNNNPEGLDLDENGWVKSLQPGQEAYAYMLMDVTYYPRGEFVVLYDGEGVIQFGLGASVISQQPGRVVIHVPENAGIQLIIKETNPDNYIRNIRVMRPEFEDNYEDDPYDPKFFELFSGFSAFRYMDFARTNFSEEVSWETRVTKDYYTQGSRKGVAIEYMVDLSNRMKVDPWFNIPTKADDHYVREFAKLVRDHLDPDLKIYLEWSNETWNGSFPAFQYAVQKGRDLGFQGSDMDVSFQYHAYRAKQIFDIWAEEFGDDADRIVNVLGGFQGMSPSQVNLLLDTANVHEVADALAIAPYFGHSYGSSKAEDVMNWTMEELFDDLMDEMIRTMEGNVKQIIDTAAKRGIPVFAYEGGQHLVSTNSDVNNKLIAVNRHPLMENIYIAYLNKWKEIGGRLMMMFTNVSKPVHSGSWGLLESLYQDVDTAPKYKGTMEFLLNNPKWWDDNEPPQADPDPEEIVEKAAAERVENGSITIDGELSEAAWSLDYELTKAIIGEPNNEVKFGVLWDEDYLYVGIHVRDDSVVNDQSASKHEDDSVEIYLDGNHDKAPVYNPNYDKQLIIRVNDDELFASSSTPGVKFAQMLTDDGYTVEAAIPWSSFGVADPKAGTVIGFDVGNNDDDDGGQRDSQLLWSGNNDNWRSTELFGDLTLVSNLPEPPADSEFEVGELTLTDLSGNPVSSLQPNTAVLARVTMTNAGDEEQQAVLIVALKDGDQILNLSLVEKSVAAGGSETLAAGFALPEDVTGLVLEAYVWDGLDTMVPLSNKTTYP